MYFVVYLTKVIDGKETVKVVNVHENARLAYAEYDSLQSENQNSHVNYSVSCVTAKYMKYLLSKRLVEVCEIVAQCLYLMDCNLKKSGSKSRARAKGFYDLALEHASRGSLYIG